MVKHCGCKANAEGKTSAAKQQDSMYGQGNRVHNKTSKTPAQYRCTVCSKVRD